MLGSRTYLVTPTGGRGLERRRLRCTSCLTLVIVLLGLTSCRRASSPSPIRIGHESDVLSLDPVAVQEAATNSILSNIFEPLATFDKDMRLIPALAVSWSTPSSNTWMIHVRPGVRFHDGRPLTSADVKYTLDRAKSDPASRVSGQLWSIEEVDVIDDTILRLATAKPDPLLIERLTYVLIEPRRSHAQPHAGPVGTGPYRFVRWEPGRFLEVEAYPDYWGGKPATERVLFVPVEQDAKCVDALRQGKLDVLRDLPEAFRDEVSAIPGIRVVARTGLASNYIWLNTLQLPAQPKNPFADKRVRQAVSLSIDRVALVARLKAVGSPATQLVQKGVFGHVSGLPVLPYDLRQARLLLQEAGYGTGLDVTLAHSTADWGIRAAEIIREMLGQAGIRVKLERMEWPVMVAAWRGASLPFFLSGWRFENGDATSFLRDCLYTRDAAQGYGTYNPGFSDPSVDRLISEIDGIFNEAERLRYFERLMQYVLDQMPLIPLYDRLNLYAVSDRIRWTPRLDGKLLAVEMSLNED
ncbi:MAG: ABC transporter substrate-binding protein [Acidobacteriota bacterium]